MTVASLRFSLLTLGALCATFGVIYAFTPGGFSWSLVLLGLLMMVPWLVNDAARRTSVPPPAEQSVPSWHPEYEPRQTGPR